MTKALRDAFREAERLPKTDQDQLAAAIQAGIEADAAWEARLRESCQALERLADEALEEDEAGRTLPLDPDER